MTGVAAESRRPASPRRRCWPPRKQLPPYTTALLQAIPLEAVTAELPGLINFLATALNITPAQV
jgi:hypothetical protein